jgi:hypothetical protein
VLLHPTTAKGPSVAQDLLYRDSGLKRPTPDVPTIDEAGMPGLHLSLWNGIWAPKGTPHDVIMKLNSAIRSALADTAVKQRLLELSQITPSSEQQTPQPLAAYQSQKSRVRHGGASIISFGQALQSGLSTSGSLT